MSSPVAAAFTFDVGTPYTNNLPTGPTVGWVGIFAPGGTITDPDGTPRSVSFTCTISFADNSGKPQTPVSRHYGEFEVFKNPSGPRQTRSTGNINLNNGGSWSVTYTITDTWILAEVPVTWDLMAYVECEDYPTQTTAWNTYYWTYMVV